MKRHVFAGAALLAASLMPATGQAQGTVKIGVILPYSGQFADTAKQVDEGIKLYMKQHGDTVAGKKIEIIRKDTGGINPPVAKRLAEELVVRDKVDILAGSLLTPNAIAAVRRVGRSQEGVMVIMNAATSIIIDQVALLRALLVHAADGHETLGNWAAKKRHQEGLYDGVRLRAGP